MKSKINILIVGIVIVGIIVSLCAVALISQAAPVEKQQSPNREVPKPIPATNIEVVKKIPLSPGIEATKGKPTLSGAATGKLGPLAAGNRYAIVIGICDYPGTANDICLSDGDSYNMYQALTTLYGYDPANIYWYRDMGDDPNSYGVDEAPTWSNISNAIMEIKGKVTLTDEVVFFFSGHGARGTLSYGDVEDPDEAIVVHNDNSTGLAYIWDDELREWFTGFGTQRIVFVFDSCLAGGMNDVADTGRVVNMATGETQSAYVYTIGELGEGVFSHYFVKEGMLQGLADGYNQLKTTDGNIAVEETFDYAKTTIPLKHPYLKQRQKPVISDSFLPDDLLL